jgi:hypothetical protein
MTQKEKFKEIIRNANIDAEIKGIIFGKINSIPETPTEEWISVVKAKRAADFLRSLNERYELSQSDQNTIVDIYGELMASAPGEINWDHIGSSGTGKVDDDGSYWYTDTEFPGMKIRLNGIREFIIDSDFNLSKIQLEKLLKGIGYWCLHQINSK